MKAALQIVQVGRGPRVDRFESAGGKVGDEIVGAEAVDSVKVWSVHDNVLHRHVDAQQVLLRLLDEVEARLGWSCDRRRARAERKPPLLAARE